MLKKVTRTCNKCGVVKAITRFGWKRNRAKERVRHVVCIDCVRAYKSAWARQPEKAKAKREYILANHERWKEYNRQYYREHKEHLKALQASYAQTVRGQTVRRDTSSKWWNNPSNKLKQQAHTAVATALRNGTLTRPSRCSICDKKRFTEAHHEDYARPLDVQWCCKTCHEDIHHLNEGSAS